MPSIRHNQIPNRNYQYRDIAILITYEITTFHNNNQNIFSKTLIFFRLCAYKRNFPRIYVL